MRLKSFLSLVVISTALCTPIYAQNTTGTTCVSDEATFKLVRLAEKAKSLENTLDRVITESASLFSIPPGLTVLAVAIAGALACSAGALYTGIMCSDCCD